MNNLKDDIRCNDDDIVADNYTGLCVVGTQRIPQILDQKTDVLYLKIVWQ